MFRSKFVHDLNCSLNFENSESKALLKRVKIQSFQVIINLAFNLEVVEQLFVGQMNVRHW